MARFGVRTYGGAQPESRGHWWERKGSGAFVLQGGRGRRPYGLEQCVSDAVRQFAQEGETRGQAPRFLVLCPPMAGLPRVVIVDVAHHVTQRGNGRQFILATDAERRV
jgi:hypothetical protein